MGESKKCKVRFIDLTGEVYGMLTVLERDYSNSKVVWLCKCECGNEKVIRSSALRHAGTKSCGCIKNLIKEGNVYKGVQKVIKARTREYPNARNSYYHLCECVHCGLRKEIPTMTLCRTKLTCKCLTKKRREEKSKAIREEKEIQKRLKRERVEREKELARVIKRIEKGIKFYTPTLKDICLPKGTIVDGEEVISHKEATELESKYFFSGVECPNGHIAKRLTLSRECTECVKEAIALKDKEKVKEYAREWYLANREDRIKKASDYQKDNIARTNARNAKRRSNRLLATPDWLDEGHIKDIESFYEQRVKEEERTGIPYHVDHIVPLQGKEVCGLHVPWNLQVIPAEENLRKSNTLIENN